jgi:hypothetical protein
MTALVTATIEVVIAPGREGVDRGTRAVLAQALSDIPHSIVDAPGPAEISYLQHICDRYDRLADVTVFLRSDVVAQQPWILDRVRSLPQDVSFCSLGRDLLVEDSVNLSGRQLQLLAEICSDWSLKSPDLVACHAGSTFAVTRERIVSRPRSVYQRALEREIASAEAAEVLERLWGIAFAAPSSRRGIVTAGDSPIFRDLQFLILSLQEYNDDPVVIYDLGLATHELHWCLSQPNVTCRPLPPLTRAMAKYVGAHRWQAWLKPAYIFDAPFDRLLWIDADCVVLDSLEGAFAQVEEGPLLLPEVCPGNGRNHSRLYDSLPVDRAARGREVEINNGVIGLDLFRDRALLSAWLYAVDWAIRNEGHRHLMRWYDQGALLWAISKTRAEAHVRSEQTWNYPAKPVPGFLRHAVRDRRSLLESIRDAHPEARVVHWFGLNKLSVALDQEVRNLFEQSGEALHR